MDWAEVTLFFFIMARMAGFILFNPLLGRSTVPNAVKTGVVLLLSITAFSMTAYRPSVPEHILEMGVRMALEFLIGYLVGVMMNFFFLIPILGGEIVDIQMGMSMGRTYDPGSQTSTTVTASMLSLLMMILFFVANGHHTLLRIFLVSGEVVTYGAASFGQDTYRALIELFITCTMMGIKLSLPVLAAELLGQVSMGILMKVIPQINVFAINIDIKVLIGLFFVLLLMTPFSEYLLQAENEMLKQIQYLLMGMG